ncbi:GNAT family N-acetyltransferase [Halomicroarcula sp. F28]|uniref:GNAT family N-acetyltransferase n=1 Tax=Haloarcula salinisoli TaxID=2487746 RepID=UPI001C731321|nr:GNAT family N-acetyltransferase [Halomicroarcula salinisoli]MBX0285139.1 GNAT family N-acetyltransferase [Halomicroarcula salinisoli]
MTDYTRHFGSDADTIEMAHAVRRRVFIEEQGVDEALEMDGRDDAATHVVLTDGSDPVATARFRFADPSTAKIERLAVLPDSRGQGLGSRVMDAAESAAVDGGATVAVLHAQVSVRGFYRELGYEPVGEQFEEAGIPHVEMRRRLG